MKVRFHSRHIPQELMNFDRWLAVELRDKHGLCSVVEPDVLRRLKDAGVDTIETRLVWWEIEPEPGRFDFSRFERALERIEQSGLRPGLFPWFQHPPKWYDAAHEKHARFRCLEHGQDTTILSLFDPKTLEVYDRLYAEVARRFGRRVQFLYVCISGDFGEVCYPSGVDHYHFSSPHNHEAFWCGDRMARADFVGAMRKKYSSLDQLNDAWLTHFSDWNEDLMPALPMRQHSLRRRRDFADWYVGSLMRFTDAAGEVARRHFPDHEIAVPLGFPFEKLWVGQIKSQAVKIAAKHRLVARWTGMGWLKSFDRTNVLARRFASAAHFYGAEFGTEAASPFTRENSADALYECLANGATLVHDDPGNMFGHEAVYRKLRPMLRGSPPVCRAAVLYPLSNELYEIDDFRLDDFIDRAARLRHQCDYDICDQHMIADGYLKRLDDLLVLVPTVIDVAAIPMIQEFLNRGGRLWLYGNASLQVIDTNAQIHEPLWQTPGRVRQVDAFPAIAPFDQFRSSEPAFFTVHEDCVTRYTPATCTIDRLPLSNHS